MKRCGISLCVLIGLVVLCAVSQVLLYRESRAFAVLTVSVEEAVQAGDSAEALRRLERLEGQWEEFHNVTGLFVDGIKLDPIRERLAEVRPLIAENHPTALPELACIRLLAEGIAEEEVPEIWHIF